MKSWIAIASASFVLGCGSKSQSTPCMTVGERLAVLDAGRMANFMTRKDRKSRAERWLSKCESLSEAQRRCVVSAATMDDANVCMGPGALPTADAAAAKATAKWVLHGNDGGWVAKLALAPNGDVIAAGDLNAKLTLGGKSVETAQRSVWIARMSSTGAVEWIRDVPGVGDRRHVSALGIGADGSILVDVMSSKGLVRFTLVADGSKAPVEKLKLDGAITVSSILAEGAIVGGVIGAKDPCGGSTAPLHRLTADGKIVWSACSDKNPETQTRGADELAVAADGSATICGEYLGPPPVWAPGAPADRMGTQAFVTTVGPDGKHRWTRYVVSANHGACEAIAMTPSTVAAIVLGDAPVHGVLAWKTDGTAGWSRECADLLPGDYDCRLWDLASDGTDYVVAVQNGAKASFLRLDGTTGATKESRVFENGTNTSTLAATPTSIVFGTALRREADFGTGALSPTPDTEIGDLVIGGL